MSEYPLEVEDNLDLKWDSADSVRQRTDRLAPVKGKKLNPLQRGVMVGTAVAIAATAATAAIASKGNVEAQYRAPGIENLDKAQILANAEDDIHHVLAGESIEGLFESYREKGFSASSFRDELEVRNPGRFIDKDGNENWGLLELENIILPELPN